MVIAAHNYRSHFGRLGSLGLGEDVIFTDTDGNRFRFQTADVEVLEPADTEKMTAGEWPLTLFTCTPGGQSRLAVRCQPIQSLPSGSSESESLF